MIGRFAVIFLALALASALAVETKIDLSGTWTRDPERSDSAPQMSPGGAGGGFPGGRGGGRFPGGSRGGEGRSGSLGGNQATTLVIQQSDREVEITRRFVGLEGDSEVTQKLPLDGSTATNPAPGGRGGEFKSVATWEKDKLVNIGAQTMSSQKGSLDIVIKEEFSLADKGQSLVVKTTRTTPRGEMSSKQIYKREKSE
jgi:hypothetical protein